MRIRDLDGEVDYVFPHATVLAAGSRVLVVSFDPANPTNRTALLASYGLSEPVTLFGPSSGRLSNEGGRLALEKPMAPDLPGEEIAWVIVDEVIYAEDTPWMPSAPTRPPHMIIKSPGVVVLISEGVP